MKIPGTIYLNGSRWWWSVKLPGETARRARPLIPVGSTLATSDRNVAQAVAEQTYRETLRAPAEAATIITVAGLVQRYHQRLRDRYGEGSKSARNVGYAIDPAAGLFAAMPVEQFGAGDLEDIRDDFIKLGWVRPTINKRIKQIVKMFKWGVSKKIVPPSVLVSLQSLEPLRAGERVGEVIPEEGRKVLPVLPAVVAATQRHMVDVLADMVTLHMLTGMRSGELVTMRTRDILQEGKVWWYTPASHKTQNKGITRRIPLGPKAQEIVKRYLSLNIDAPLFSAASASKQRRDEMRAARKSKVQPSQLNRAKWTRPARDHFTPDTYNQAIRYAIRRANAAGENIPHWHPHQLRHTAATNIRKALGRDAAKSVLGHTTMEMIDNYAEIEEKLAGDAARRLG